MATQTIPTKSSARTRQIIGAVLIASTNILWLAYYLKSIFSTSSYDSFVDAAIESAILMGGICCILIAGWALLLTTASNMATRIACIIAIVATTLSLLSRLYTQYAYVSLFTDMPVNEVMDIIGLVFSFLTTFITPLMWIYLYITIIKANDDIETSNRGWIHLLIITNMATFCVNTYAALALMILPEVVLRPQFTSWMFLAFILVTIAEFRMAMCRAFNGECSDHQATWRTYLHLNRYTIAVAVAVVVIIGAWILMNNNAAVINDLINI